MKRPTGLRTSARRLRRVDVPTLRAAWWTLGALVRTRLALRRRAIGGVVVGAPPPLPVHAGRGVHAVLRRVPNTCLERALVLQRWLAQHGVVKDVVVGVTSPRDFRAHAWLDGDRVEQEFQELTRLPPP